MLYIPLIAIILIYTVIAIRYRMTTYYAATRKWLISIIYDKGSLGEYQTYKYLRKYEKDGAKFLFNCYLPKENDQTTEADVIMLHKSGIYVFESKNYSGWIFGTEYSKTWTQSLPNGRRSHKEHFLNPIMQNKLHIKWLMNQIGENELIHSVIVFSERCALKKISMKSTDIFVIKRNDVLKTVKAIEKKSGNVIAQARINEIYEQLYPYTQVSDNVKQKHIADIKKTLDSSEKEEYAYLSAVEEASLSLEAEKNSLQEAPASDSPLPGKEPLTENSNLISSEGICPNCGGTLVLRETKKGKNAGSKFYGCSNYPKCRFMKPV